MATRIEDIAEAYETVARVNHYMVGIDRNTPTTLDELEGARQLLITQQNIWSNGSPVWVRLERALDLIDRDIAERED